MTTHTVTLNQLESHLWEAANILRGPVDAADFKTYVFPLLFFKRLSDVHDEEYQTALEESGDDEEYARFPQNYRFQVPEGCHWRDVRAVTTNVGQALQTALRGGSRGRTRKRSTASSVTPSGRTKTASLTHCCAT
jgi:type I restriction enzyme M protein